MADTDPSLFDLVSSHHDRAGYRALHWEGTFADYLAIVEADPRVTRD